MQNNHPSASVLGIDLELKEGETWDDRLTITLPRIAAASALAALLAQAVQLASMTHAAQRDAEQGNLGATLVVGTLMDANLQLAEALQRVAQVVKPDMGDDLERLLSKARKAMGDDA